MIFEKGVRSTQRRKDSLFNNPENEYTPKDNKKNFANLISEEGLIFKIYAES